ncbi:MAG: hypothetical protein J7I99_04740 [Methanophagales archaeon]|nr:hypothetical protein [Methanophagales archaeon]
MEYLSECQPGKEIQLKGEDAPDIARMLFDWSYFLHYFSYFGFWEVKRIRGWNFISLITVMNGIFESN